MSVTPDGLDPDGDAKQRGGVEDTLRTTSSMRREPDWMRRIRLASRRHFIEQPMPDWVSDLSGLSLDGLFSPLRPPAEQPPQPRSVTERDGEEAFRRNREDLERQGVLFTDMATALRDAPELVQPYFAKIVPPDDNKFSALNTSLWSGGSFVYVPPGLEVEIPLQAHPRDGTETRSQFERTLVVADAGSRFHVIEGCSAPVYSSDALHAGVVEVVVKPNAHVTYTALQNWSGNVFNLVTKRAIVEAEGHMEWIDGNIGSRLTMQYPAVYLVGPKATGRARSVAYAGRGQRQDTGAKMVHLADETTSEIVAKSISKDGGQSSHRNRIRVDESARRCTSHGHYHALILDDDSSSGSYPSIEIGAGDAEISHTATDSRITAEQLFYLMSRGLSQEQAIGIVVNGFIEPITRTLPIEYAVEWSRLVELQMEGSVG